MVTTSAKDSSLPADLAPTEDVQITPAITAKAQELDSNPLKIYQYVRNNVEYMPTYGSIEGSDYTMQTLRGNDMDQASLLIALLRAANIPAHYVYGTIRVPIDQVENWVGNVTDPQAALDLMSQGGIPTLGLAQGGVIKFAQIEHVWVEAQMSYAPSRGAVTTPGTTWVPMDPSYKQYTYTDGMDLKSAVPFDAQAFADHIKNTSTINTSEGWVQGVDQNYVTNQLTDYQAQVQDYVTSQKPDATVGDVIGTKTIQPETLPLLPASLPYTVTATASHMDALPDNLRWKFRYVVGGQTLIERGLPGLAGHRMSLSFAPNTEADKQTLRSYLPDNVSDQKDLPDTLPAGVVQLESRFSIDGETIATGPTYTLGDSLTIREAMYQPNKGWTGKDNTFTAGDYQAVAVIGTSNSLMDVDALKTDVQRTNAALQSGQFANLTKHDLVGALMQTALLSYFVQIHTQMRQRARGIGMAVYPLPSFGSISTHSRVSLLFGTVPTTITPSGIMADMDRIAWIGVEKDHHDGARKTYNEILGVMISRAESGVLEREFSNSDQQLHGISAVQALSIAAAQGQRIYTINPDNAAITMSQINLQPSVMQEIANAVNAGKSVTTSQSTIDYQGVATSGYIIIDPFTGAGAYKIANGEDGSFLKYWHQISGNIGSLLFVCGIAVEFCPVAAFLVWTILIINVLVAILNFLATDAAASQGSCVNGRQGAVAQLTFDIMGIISGFAGTAALLIMGIISDIQHRLLDVQIEGCSNP